MKFNDKKQSELWGEFVANSQQMKFHISQSSEKARKCLKNINALQKYKEFSVCQRKIMEIYEERSETVIGALDMSNAPKTTKESQKEEAITTSKNREYIETFIKEVKKQSETMAKINDKLRFVFSMIGNYSSYSSIKNMIEESVVAQMELENAIEQIEAESKKWEKEKYNGSYLIELKNGQTFELDIDHYLDHSEEDMEFILRNSLGSCDCLKEYNATNNNSENHSDTKTHISKSIRCDLSKDNLKKAVDMVEQIEDVIKQSKKIQKDLLQYEGKPYCFSCDYECDNCEIYKFCNEIHICDECEYKSECFDKRGK